MKLNIAVFITVFLGTLGYINYIVPTYQNTVERIAYEKAVYNDRFTKYATGQCFISDIYGNPIPNYGPCRAFKIRPD